MHIYLDTARKKKLHLQEAGLSERKNDSCYVEQKNYSVIRRAVGYLRYGTDEELEIINQIYAF